MSTCCKKNDGNGDLSANVDLKSELGAFREPDSGQFCFISLERHHDRTCFLPRSESGDTYLDFILSGSYVTGNFFNLNGNFAKSAACMVNYFSNLDINTKIFQGNKKRKEFVDM